MKIGIIIQARVDSSRLPRKVLQLIDDETVLWHVINQCKEICKEVIVATTSRKLDDPIIKIANKAKVKSFRGSKNDVLDRYYKTAKKFQLDRIIRITADCPIVDPKESLKVVKQLKLNKFEYIALDESTYPDGVDTEGFTFTALETAWKNAKLRSEREHVSPYIKKNKFRKKIITYKKNLSHLRFTVDYKDDLKFLRSIFSKLNNKKNIHLNEILRILEENPQLVKINASHKRNEGYKESLKNDKIVIN